MFLPGNPPPGTKLIKGGTPRKGLFLNAGSIEPALNSIAIFYRKSQIANIVIILVVTS